jgi:hypothetical protein
MKNYKIIEADPDSSIDSLTKYYEDILNLWKNNLSDASDERFRWLYKHNSAGRTRTWLAIDEKDNEVVGCNSLYPRYICKNGERLKIGIAIDFAINKEHRVFGPALKIQRKITDNIRNAGFDFAFTWPNEASKGVFFRAGYRILGEARNWVKVLKAEPQIVKYIRIPLIPKISGYFIDKVLSFLDFIFIVRAPENLATETSKVCDSRFDELWKRGKLNYKIIGEKSSDYLNWRYASCKIEQYMFFCLVDKKSRVLRGYLVYSIKKNIATIWDLFTINNDDIVYLLSKFIVQMRKEKSSSISITCLENNHFEKIIKSLIFFKRASKRTCAIFLDKDCLEKEQKFILDKNNWFILDGEMDL